jgi:phosphoribosyl 1,2-cyclic phosphate phosphodiesterase
MKARFTIIGSGTSHGIPVIACSCQNCHSPVAHDWRDRCAGILECDDGTRILIDCGPEIRAQLLKARIPDITAVCVTHSHADHVLGLADLRRFARHHALPIFANPRAAREIRLANDAVWPRYPNMSVNEIETEPIVINGITVVPIPMMHGKLPTTGFRIGNFAYLTDANFIPESSFELLQGLNLVVIDGLTQDPHPTHFSFVEAVDALTKFRPERAWLTHLSHELTHEQAKELVEEMRAERPELADSQVQIAYDWLQIQIDVNG